MDIKSKSLAIKAYCTQITGNKLFDVIKQTIEKAEPQSNLAFPYTDVFGRKCLLQISGGFMRTQLSVCFIFVYSNFLRPKFVFTGNCYDSRLMKATYLPT